MTSSWSGGARRYDPEKQELETVGPDERSDAEIAAEIVAAQITNPSASSVDAVVAVARALDTVVPQRGGGFGRTSGPRLRQRPGGPVASARFT